MADYNSAYTGEEIDSAIKLASELQFPLPLLMGGTGGKTNAAARRNIVAQHKFIMLWGNSDPTGDFTAHSEQPRDSLYEYSIFLIAFQYISGTFTEQNRFSTIAYVDQTIKTPVCLLGGNSSKFATASRVVNISRMNNLFEFENAYTHTGSNGNSKDNSRIIPLYIYGSKME